MSSSYSAQAEHTNEYKICENCQISKREIWAHNTQDKDKHNATQKTKEMNNADPTTNPEWSQVFAKCKLSNIICPYVMTFFMFSELMWEVVVCFFGGIVYHCLLNFLFIISIWLELIKLYLNACFFFFIGVRKKHKGFDNKWWHDLLATCDVEVEWMKKKI